MRQVQVDFNNVVGVEGDTAFIEDSSEPLAT